jgi:hypothetical protein
MRKLELSPYYPPRARWYCPLLRIADEFRRLTWLDRIHLPAGISFIAFVSALLVPGFALYVHRERVLARLIIAGYALLLAVFILWLGYPIANVAFGLMLSLHATSVIFLINPWLGNARLPFQLLVGMAVLGVLGGLLYAPLRHQLQTCWLLPLRIRDQVVIVQTFSPAPSVRAGDWIAYEIEADRGQGWRLESGYALGPVLAVAGDRVRFTTTTYEINGVYHPHRPHMPVTGELMVPENHWFLWPDLAINVYGNPNPATVEAAMLRIATVSRAQFVGKPFHRWFWRRQMLQ